MVREALTFWCAQSPPASCAIHVKALKEASTYSRKAFNYSYGTYSLKMGADEDFDCLTTVTGLQRWNVPAHFMLG